MHALHGILKCFCVNAGNFRETTPNLEANEARSGLHLAQSVCSDDCKWHERSRICWIWLEGKCFISSLFGICILEIILYFLSFLSSLVYLPSIRWFSVKSKKRNKTKGERIKIPFTHDLFLTLLSPARARCAVHPQFFTHKCVERAGREALQWSVGKYLWFLTPIQRWRLKWLFS